MGPRGRRRPRPHPHRHRRRRHTIPVVSVNVAGFADVYKALASLKRRFPARLLRQLKEQVYDLVLTSESKGKVYVQDLDAAADTADIDMVIGVGIKDRLDTVGVIGLTRADLLHDVLKDTSALGSPADIVDKALPLLLKHRANTPVYAYLRAAGRLDADGALADPAANPASVAARVDAGTRPLLPPNDYRRRGREIIAEAGDLTGLIARGDTDEVLFYAPMLPADKIDTDVLRAFLTANSHLLTTGHSLQATQWSKCVCLYDLLRNQRTS